MKPHNPINIGNVRSLAVHAPNWLGDSVMALPLVEEIRACRAAISICVIARPALAYLWQSHPDVNRVVTYDRFDKRHRIRNALVLVGALRQYKCDVAIILPAGPEFPLLHLLAGVRYRVGYSHAGCGPLLTHAVPIDSGFRDRHLADSYAALAGVFGGQSRPLRRIRMPMDRAAPEDRPVTPLPADRPSVFLHVGASYGPAKRWPSERFAELGDRLAASHDAQVVLIGDEESRSAGREVTRSMKTPALDLCGRTPLPELALLLSNAQLLVSTDSGPAHLAAALDVPTLTLFGSTSPNWTRPLGTYTGIIHHAPACGPCFQRRCPLGTTACFMAISAEEAWRSAAALLDERRVRVPDAGPACLHLAAQ